MADDQDPIARAQAHARVQLPKRFYKHAAVARDGEGFAVTLDGRQVRTPGRSPLSVPSAAIAEAVAAEWEAQADVIDPGTMPLTRLVNTALDGVANAREAIARDVAAYAASDLVCYRAEDPDGLVAMQAAAWDPLVDWFAGRYGVTLRLAAGVMPVEQDHAAIEALGEALCMRTALDLAALHTLTTLAGSAVIALAVTDGVIDADTGWAAAHVDEDWQIRLWGEDAEAMARRALRKQEFDAAAMVLASSGSPEAT